MPSRRNFLKILGGGTIAAAAGATAFAMTRTPTNALAPWDAAAGETDPIRRALAHALLAPNPHNRQPWLVDLSVDGQVTILRDESRDLPMTDPFNRQIFIGMGCFLETMVIAASQTGHTVDLDILPDGDEGPIAVARFSEGAQADRLAAHILNRHSAKEVYQDKPLAPEAIEELSPLATIIDDAARVEQLRQLTWDAFQVEVYTPHTYRESVDLMRIGKAEINANPDGIEITSPLLEVLRRTGMLSNEAMLNTDGAGVQNHVKGYEDICFATPAYAVLTTRGNTRQDQIAAGRQWMRLSLTTTALGLGLHPMSQALQEFPEMRAHYDTAHEMLAQPGETVQMLARLGYGGAPKRTPRWGLETRIIGS